MTLARVKESRGGARREEGEQVLARELLLAQEDSPLEH